MIWWCNKYHFFFWSGFNKYHYFEYKDVIYLFIYKTICIKNNKSFTQQHLDKIIRYFFEL